MTLLACGVFNQSNSKMNERWKRGETTIQCRCHCGPRTCVQTAASAQHSHLSRRPPWRKRPPRENTLTFSSRFRSWWWSPILARYPPRLKVRGHDVTFPLRNTGWGNIRVKGRYKRRPSSFIWKANPFLFFRKLSLQNYVQRKYTDLGCFFEEYYDTVRRWWRAAIWRLSVTLCVQLTVHAELVARAELVLKEATWRWDRRQKNAEWAGLQIASFQTTMVSVLFIRPWNHLNRTRNETLKKKKEHFFQLLCSRRLTKT